MKELSIKEKAERYDELLEKLRKAKEDNNVCDERYCCVIDDIVPELKESEDEGIRKGLIDFVNQYGDNFYGQISKEHAIAWLEKQGEQKHQYKSRPRYVGEEELLGANKQGEQKSAENEELTEFDKAVGVSIGTWNPKSPEQIQSVKAVSKKLLKLAKKQINDEQKPAEWSKDDEQYLLVCKNALSKYQVSDKWDAGIISRWLEERLKSLRPQNRWEPSDEQMTALRRMKAAIAGEGEIYKPLNSLYEDLKKLRKE